MWFEKDLEKKQNLWLFFFTHLDKFWIQKKYQILAGSLNISLYAIYKIYLIFS